MECPLLTKSGTINGGEFQSHDFFQVLDTVCTREPCTIPLIPLLSLFLSHTLSNDGLGATLYILLHFSSTQWPGIQWECITSVSLC